MCMVRDIGGYAAECDSLERTEAARAHDDKMALLLCCHRDRYWIYTKKVDTK